MNKNLKKFEIGLYYTVPDRDKIAKLLHIFQESNGETGIRLVFQRPFRKTRFGIGDANIDLVKPIANQRLAILLYGKED